MCVDIYERWCYINMICVRYMVTEQREMKERRAHDNYCRTKVCGRSVGLPADKAAATEVSSPIRARSFDSGKCQWIRLHAVIPASVRLLYCGDNLKPTSSLGARDVCLEEPNVQGLRQKQMLARTH